MLEKTDSASLAYKAEFDTKEKCRISLEKFVRNQDGCELLNQIKSEIELIIADELNVKSVVRMAGLEGKNPGSMKASGVSVFLDTILTPELIEEGKLRELMRAIQEVRKEMKFNPQDKARMEFSGDDVVVAFVKKYGNELIKKTNLAGMPTFNKDTVGKTIVAEDLHLTVKLEKV